MRTGFGEDLRKEREAKGLGVEDICAATKVSAQHVEALEAGEISRLPGGVFRRGIVRGYLGAVGLDEVVWMERFESFCQELGLAGAGDKDWVQFAENVSRGRAGEPRGMGWKWLGVALLVVSLWAIAWLAWHFVVHPRLEQRTTAAMYPAGLGFGGRQRAASAARAGEGPLAAKERLSGVVGSHSKDPFLRERGPAG